VVGGVELKLEPCEAAAALDTVATPSVGEPIDQEKAVTALRLKAAARTRSVGPGVEYLDADLLVGGGDPNLDRLVLAGAAVLDRVGDELAEKKRQTVTHGVGKSGLN